MSSTSTDMENNNKVYNEFVIMGEDEVSLGADAHVYNGIYHFRQNKEGDRIINVELVKTQGFGSRHYFYDEVEVVWLKTSDDNYTFLSKHTAKFGRPGHSCHNHESANMAVVRYLEPKRKYLEKFEKNWAKDVVFVVNGQKCLGDRRYLSAVSPVFDRMLNGEFMEARQQEITLEDNISAEIFNDFLKAISRERIPPTPNNVVQLLKMAHFYDIPFLMKDCEQRLMFAYEIPLIDRIILAKDYELEVLRAHIGRKFTADTWKIFVRSNSGLIMKDLIHFYDDLTLTKRWN